MYVIILHYKIVMENIFCVIVKTKMQYLIFFLFWRLICKLEMYIACPDYKQSRLIAMFHKNNLIFN